MLKLSDYLDHEIWLNYQQRVARLSGARGQGFNDVVCLQLKRGGKVIKTFWYRKMDAASHDRAFRRLKAFCLSAAGIIENPEPKPCMALMCLPR